MEIPLVAPPTIKTHQQPLVLPRLNSTLTPSTQEMPWSPSVFSCRLCGEQTREKDCVGCLAPLTPSVASFLLKMTTQALRDGSDGALVFNRTVRVEMVSDRRLRELGGETLLGLYQDEVIYLSSRLSRREAVAVLGHELGHAWLIQNRSEVDTLDELFFEGFAEFVSWLVLTHLRDRRQVASIELDPSVYGQGARLFLERYHKFGLEKVLQYALSGRVL